MDVRIPENEANWDSSRFRSYLAEALSTGVHIGDIEIHMSAAQKATIEDSLDDTKTHDKLCGIKVVVV